MTRDDTASIDAPDMLAATGATYRQLNYWTTSGYLRTDSNPNPGSGRGRTWPASEVPVVALMARLSDAGVLASTAAVVARGLVERGSALLVPGVSLARVSSLGWPDEHTGAPR